MTDTSKAINPDPTGKVTLREITADTLGSILNLSVSEDQERFVASNARSIAQAHFSEHAWFRAIYASEEPVGFVMLYDKPEKGEYSLWRFMIDARYQGRGYGRAALLLVIAHIRTRPKTTHRTLQQLRSRRGRPWWVLPVPRLYRDRRGELWRAGP